MTDRVEDSALFKAAAAAARIESQRYWAKGGPADRRYPVHADIERMWPLVPDDTEQRHEPTTERGLPG